MAETVDLPVEMEPVRPIMSILGWGGSVYVSVVRGWWWKWWKSGRERQRGAGGV